MNGSSNRTRVPRVSVRRVFALAWQISRRDVITLLCLSLASAVIQPLTVWLGRDLVNLIVLSQSDTAVSTLKWTSLSVTLGAAFGLQRVLPLTLQVRQRLFGERLSLETERMFLRRVWRTEFRELERPEWQDEMVRASHGISAHLAGFIQSNVQILRSVVASAGMLAVLVTVDPILIVFAAAFVLLSWPYQHLQGLMFHRTRRRFAKNERSRAYLRILMSDIFPAKDVRAYDLGPNLMERSDSLGRSWLDAIGHVVRSLTRYSILVGFGTSAVGALGYYMAVDAGVRGSVSAGGLTAVIGAFTGLAAQLSLMSAGTSGAAEDRRSVTDFLSFVGDASGKTSGSALPDGPWNRKGPAPGQDDGLTTELRGEQERSKCASTHGLSALRRSGGVCIEIDDVSYKYEGADGWALCGVSLRVEPGELVAIVGPNGSGKTTLVKLLMRFYDPTGGSIRFDGVDIIQLDQEYVRAKIGVLFEDFVIFDFSIRENIYAGRIGGDIREGSLEQAIAATGLGSVVERLPDGVDTELGHLYESAVDLSSGERQRLALARLMFRDPTIWILDEPTSVLDPEGELIVFNEVKRRLDARRTGIVVSHRFSTVRMADRVVVMDSGQVVEQGSHLELLQRRGRYAEMFRRQVSDN